jgi:hypothetical protein
VHGSAALRFCTTLFAESVFRLQLRNKCRCRTCSSSTMPVHSRPPPATMPVLSLPPPAAMPVLSLPPPATMPVHSLPPPDTMPVLSRPPPAVAGGERRAGTWRRLCAHRWLSRPRTSVPRARRVILHGRRWWARGCAGRGAAVSCFKRKSRRVGVCGLTAISQHNDGVFSGQPRCESQAHSCSHRLTSKL